MQNALLQHVEKFLHRFLIDADTPLLLGLSGGSDSMALFHLLKQLQKKKKFSLHAAYIDHGWRTESAEEALTLKKICEEEGVIFHTTRLDFGPSSSNLEERAREGRLLYFKEIYDTIRAAALILAHHQNDVSETVLKRIFEGAGFWHLHPLQEETHLYGMRVLRPLLTASKSELVELLCQEGITWFEDATNKDPRFLRSRLREKMVPDLEKTFGKNVMGNLLELGKSFELLQDFFKRALEEKMASIQEAPYGFFLPKAPSDFLTCKLMLQKMGLDRKISFSKEIWERAAKALSQGERNKCFASRDFHLVIDHFSAFVFPALCPRFFKSQTFDTEQSSFSQQDAWGYQLKTQLKARASWQENWSEGFETRVSQGVYVLEPYEKVRHNKALKNRLQKVKVPLFLRHWLPYLVDTSGHVFDFFSTPPTKEFDSVNVNLKIIRSC